MPNCSSMTMMMRFLYPQREWHGRPENAARWQTNVEYMTAWKLEFSVVAMGSRFTKALKDTELPLKYDNYASWFGDALRVIHRLIAFLTAAFPERMPLAVRQYIDYWHVVIAQAQLYCTKHNKPSWTWWLALTDPQKAVVPSIYDADKLELGQRILTHFHVISNPVKSLTPAAEKHDIPLCLVRRAWQPRIPVKAFTERMRKLCAEPPHHKTESAANKASRRLCMVILRRLLLASWLGLLESKRIHGKSDLTATERRTLVFEWFHSLDEDTLQWSTHIGPHMDLIVEALSAYMRAFVQDVPGLRMFLARHFPKWPRGPGPNVNATCWLPGPPLAFLRATFLTSKPLRKFLATTDTSEDVEFHAQCVLDTSLKLSGSNHLHVLAVLAEWHNISRSLLDPLLAQLQLYRNGTLTKSRVRKILSQWLANDSERHVLVWLCGIINTWAAGTLVRVIPAPYQWTVNVAACFARQEQLLGRTVSPMSDVFLFCPTCLRVCTIVTRLIAPTRRRRKKRRKRKMQALATAASLSLSASAHKSTKVSAEAAHAQHADEIKSAVSCGGNGAGFEDVVVDADNDYRLMCASRKAGLTVEQCAVTELQMIHLTGNIVYYHDRVYMMCPQPFCGRVMQLEPQVCKFTEHGPCCRVCTLGLHDAPAQEDDDGDGDEDESEEPEELYAQSDQNWMGMAERVDLVVVKDNVQVTKQPHNERLFDDSDDEPTTCMVRDFSSDDSDGGSETDNNE